MPSACLSLFITLLLSISLSSQAIAADNSPQSLRYVSDFLVINLKNRIERPYTVVDHIKSNAPLTVLGERGKYIHVRTADDKVGWVAKQYTTTKLPKSLIIKNLEEEISQLKQSQPPASQIVEEKIQELQLELNRAQEEIIRLSKSQATAVPSQSISPEEHQRIVAQVQILKKQLARSKRESSDEKITQESSSKGNYSNIYWFIAGVGTLLIGFLLGKIPEKRRQKRVFY
ncbi:TIGR04211 family SH3 domain-containing protein [Desulfotalea psychrophila]|nr:TIGR04211 family SH3 domain-containing protein [Desulfotalea psychrophila]